MLMVDDEKTSARIAYRGRESADNGSAIFI